MEALKGLADNLLSPAKMVFIGYIVLGYTGKVTPSFCQFISIAIAFLVTQILHDDWLRIILNDFAFLSSDRRRIAVEKLKARHDA